MNIPTIKITKTAGPSPASSLEKSAWQASQRGANSSNPLKRLPSPQMGHLPRNPVWTGGNALMDAARREEDIDKGKEEEPDDIDEMPIPRRRFEAEMFLGFKPAAHQAGPADKEENRPDENM